ncbi:MAG: DinB family protein [Acidobacteriota bacterium]
MEHRQKSEPRPAAAGLPERDEAASYYFKYIDRVPGPDVLAALETQLDPTLAFLRGISEERSLHRYAPEKWSIRELLGHVNDTERLFVFRAFWFARGFDSSLPSFDEKASASEAAADGISWARHIEEFRAVRSATVAFFRNLPAPSWRRRGIASDNPFSVRALAYIVAGHLDHHVSMVRESYGAGAD